MVILLRQYFSSKVVMDGELIRGKQGKSHWYLANQGKPSCVQAIRLMNPEIL
jgi:hypothetical protein